MDESKFVRCVKQDQKPRNFPIKTAMKASWQRSTGWMPQPLETAPVATTTAEPTVAASAAIANTDEKKQAEKSAKASKTVTADSIDK